MRDLDCNWFYLVRNIDMPNSLCGMYFAEFRYAICNERSLAVPFVLCGISTCRMHHMKATCHLYCADSWYDESFAFYLDILTVLCGISNAECIVWIIDMLNAESRYTVSMARYLECVSCVAWNLEDVICFISLQTHSQNVSDLILFDMLYIIRSSYS